MRFPCTTLAILYITLSNSSKLMHSIVSCFVKGMRQIFNS